MCLYVYVCWSIRISYLLTAGSYVMPMHLLLGLYLCLCLLVRMYFACIDCWIVCISCVLTARFVCADCEVLALAAKPLSILSISRPLVKEWPPHTCTWTAPWKTLSPTVSDRHASSGSRQHTLCLRTSSISQPHSHTHTHSITCTFVVMI